MMGKWTGRMVLLLGCMFLTISLTGCNGLELMSPWRDRDIVIDGDAREWSGLTTYVEKGNIAVGVTNDEESLFLCFHSPTRQVAGQIVMQGLTVWVDPDGGSDGKLGVHCPIGSKDMVRPDGGMGDREKMEDMILRRLEETASEVELLGPDDEVYGTFAAGDIPGLEVALAYAGGRIVYELKLPLETTDEIPYALAVDWEKEVGIGFVTPKIDMEAMRDSMRETMGDGMPEGPGPGGGRGGGMPGGGMPGGPDGPGGGMRGGMPDPVELWCRARLTPPGSAGEQ